MRCARILLFLLQIPHFLLSHPFNPFYYMKYRI